MSPAKSTGYTSAMIRLRLRCSAFWVDVRLREINGRWIASADTLDGPSLGLGKRRSGPLRAQCTRSMGSWTNHSPAWRTILPSPSPALAAHAADRLWFALFGWLPGAFVGVLPRALFALATEPHVY